MTCAWNEFLELLPQWMRSKTDEYGKDKLLELRLRDNSPPELVTASGSVWLQGLCRKQDIDWIVNAASDYSPWNAESIALGYCTSRGGHRIGICGIAATKDGAVCGMQRITSLCIRIARDIPGVSSEYQIKPESVLILGAPGWGKTTFLRDLLRRLSQKYHVGVVDEREEIFPSAFLQQERIDVLRRYPKAMGIELILRSMNPAFIAVDEITADRDCRALIQAAHSGVHLIATAHASSISDLHSRPIYRPLLSNHIFDSIIQLQPDRSCQIYEASVCI